MKNNILVTSLAVLLISGTAIAQPSMKHKEEIPKAVTDAFKKDYPSVQKVNWDVEKGTYEAEFDLNKTDISVTYSATGEKLETETEIPRSQMPVNALNYVVNQKYGKIKETAKIVQADGTVTYEAEVKKGDLIFDKSGNFLKLHVD